MTPHELVSYLLLGAYGAQTFDCTFKMMTRVFNHEDYTPWQRQIYACWAAIMGYIFLQNIWGVYIKYTNIDWYSDINLNVRTFILLTVQLCGLFLIVTTTHRKLTWKTVAIHLVPAIIFYIVSCVLRPIFPVLYQIAIILNIVYVIIMAHVLIRNIDRYNRLLTQSYSDTYKRGLNWMYHLLWMFIIAMTCVTVMRYYFNYDLIFYPIMMCLWFFVHWNVSEMRETDLIAEEESQDLVSVMTDEELEAEVAQETQDAKNEKVSLRDKTKKRLEETIENVCVERRLYLNPDLTINDLAKEVNTNRTYISKYFSEHHTTFLKYINDLRAEFAMYQLKNTNHSISEIMEDSGFRHTETFKRAFQSRYNCLPNDVSRKDTETKENPVKGS